MEEGIFLDALSLAGVALGRFRSRVLTGPLARLALDLFHKDDLLVSTIECLLEAQVDAYVHIFAIKVDTGVLAALLVLLAEVEVEILRRGGA
jgi:hypothetical protein